jgi:biotin operon repressor
MGQTRVQIVEDYFLANPDKDLQIDRISADTGLERQQVTQAIYGIRTRGRRPLPVFQTRPHFYRLVSADLVTTPEPPKRQFPKPEVPRTPLVSKSGQTRARGRNGNPPLVLGLLVAKQEAMSLDQITQKTGLRRDQTWKAAGYLGKVGAVKRPGKSIYQVDNEGTLSFLGSQAEVDRLRALGESLLGRRHPSAPTTLPEAPEPSQGQPEPSPGPDSFADRLLEVPSPVLVPEVVEEQDEQAEDDVQACLELILPVVPTRLINRFNLITRALVQLVKEANR